jgi:hypothetical protein
MTNRPNIKKQQRLREIEDRKIEILVEITSINDHYNENVSRLNSEYTRLDREYYFLKLELISKRN